MDLSLDSFSGGTPTSSISDYWSGDIYWASPKDFSDEIIIDDTQDRITEEGRKAAGLDFAEQGDVLLVVRSGILRHTLPVAVAGRRMTVNQDIKVLKLAADVEPSFFATYFQVNQARLLPLITKHGTTVQSINTAELQQLLIPLPPINVQRALVSEVEAARDERRRKLAEADELLNSLDSWLLAQLGLESPLVENRKVFAVRLGDIQGRVDPYFYQPRFAKVIRELASSRFPLQAIDNICEPPVGGATPTRGDADLYTDDGIKFLRILNVKPNEIDLADVKFIRSPVHNGELSRSQLAANDVLMTITGRVGTTAVVPQEILPANINQHIVRLRLKSDECSPDYLAAYLNTSLGLAISNRSVTGGTRIALDYQAIRSLPVPIPTKPIQEKVVEELNKRRIAARRLRHEAETEWQQAKKRFEEQLLTGDKQ